MNNESFVSELSKIRSGSTFLNLHKYTNSGGEVADYNIIFHISYENALKRSIAILESLVPDSDLQALAKHELLESYHKSIAKMSETAIEDLDDGYTRFDGVKGIKLHNKTGILHLYGMVHQKRVVVPGIYKKTASKPLTVEKDKLTRKVPVGKFRQFKLSPDNVEQISVEGLHLLPPEG